MSGRAVRSFALLAIWPAIAFAPIATAQEDHVRDRVATLVRRLHMKHTDWTLFLDVSDKVLAIGSPAVPVIDAELAGERAKTSRRYALRLLGVLAAIERRGIDELAAAIDGDDFGLAAVAARILGRCRGDRTTIENAFVARLRPGARSGIVGALAMGASDAGVKAVAAPLRLMLANHAAREPDAHWVTVAAGTLTDGLEDIRKCLAASGSLQKVGILAARTVRDEAVMKRLKELIETTDDPTTWEWIMQAFGAVGDDEVRERLRQSIEGEPEEILSTELDDRRLALIRLGDRKQIEWALGHIVSGGRGQTGGVTTQVLGPELAALPDLLAKWRVDGVVEALAALGQNPAVSVWQRAYVARGLSRLRDRAGPDLAAALLAAGDHRASEFDLAGSLNIAQCALHHFIADTSRPDYVPIERGTEGVAIEVGEQWKKWLGGKGTAIAWRDAREETDDLLFWK